ncbi:MAG: hypothetical protein ACR5LD_12090 [Symbiopectobacterium sp.]
MTVEKSEQAMTFGELLALIENGDQQHKIDSLELAFFSLTFSLNERTVQQLLLHNLKLESHNEHRAEQTKNTWGCLLAYLKACRYQHRMSCFTSD